MVGLRRPFCSCADEGLSAEADTGREAPKEGDFNGGDYRPQANGQPSPTFLLLCR